MITLYGLRNCDTCRKALKWLDAEGKAHQFRDIRADGPDAARLQRWIDAVGWEALLNRRGTTWRKLPDADKANVDAARAKTLMLAHPAIVKRPVVEAGGEVVVGFGDAQKAALKAAG